MSRDEIGTMLTMAAADDLQSPIVNDSGMGGTGGRIHLHSNSANDMYQSGDGAFLFDIGHIDKLGKLYIWNYNAPEDTGSGVREVEISISEDNESYSSPITYILKKASGEDGIEATNLEDGSVVDFSGKSGRYVRMRALSNYGGTDYGLSEIRLFRYKQPIVEGEGISCSPLERYVNRKWSAEPEDYGFLNGTGLSDFQSAEATHDNNPGHMFSQKADALDFTIDLKGEYPISKIVIWNYNDKEHLDYGLEKFRLKLSGDYSTWKTVGAYTLAQGDGSEALKPSLTIDLDGEVRCHYLKLEILGNYGGDRVGLSEVSVFLGSGWYCDTASDYSALLSNYDGWAGADGIYTVNLDGKDYDYDGDSSAQKTFFVFSDTIVSYVDPVTKKRGDYTMPNNTGALLTGKIPVVRNISFTYPGRGEAAANIVPDKRMPATKPGRSLYYWLGDTFVTGDKLYVYCLRIDTVNTSPGFAQVGVDLASYDIKDGEVDYDTLNIVSDDGMRLCDISDGQAKWYFGGAVYQSTTDAGVMDPDGYVYVYGYQDKNDAGRGLIVSRVKPENIRQFDRYEYLNGQGGWVPDPPAEYKFLAEDVAPECSVTQIQEGEYKGRLLLVNTHLTNTATIMVSAAAKPYEVFEDKTAVYTHDDCLTIPGRDNNTYNAKAHPALSDKDELIISYNVNGPDCFQYADIYRPRFLRIAMVGSVSRE